MNIPQKINSSVVLIISYTKQEQDNDTSHHRSKDGHTGKMVHSKK